MYTGLVTYNIELHHFQIADEINIMRDKQAPIIVWELLSIFLVIPYTDFRRNSANVRIPLDTTYCLIYNVMNAVTHLKTGKSDGSEGLSSNHFIHGNRKIYIYSCQFYLHYF